MKLRREGDWWLGGFLAAFFLGFALTLTYAWFLNPPAPVTTPADLDPVEKERYIVLVAAAYRHDGNLEKANQRLAKLKDKDIASTVVVLAERYIAAGADVRDVRSLATLAAALGQRDAALAVYLPITPSPSPTPAPTRTPQPSATSTVRSVTMTPAPTRQPTASPTITLRSTSTPGPNAPFELAQSVALCDNTANSELRVYVNDFRGRGVAGVEVRVSWPGGSDRFYTGLKSALNPGYADFQMVPDQTYQIELVNLPSVVTATAINAQADTLCPTLPVGVAPSWQVVFQQGGNR